MLVRDECSLPPLVLQPLPTLPQNVKKIHKIYGSIPVKFWQMQEWESVFSNRSWDLICSSQSIFHLHPGGTTTNGNKYHTYLSFLRMPRSPLLISGKLVLHSREEELESGNTNYSRPTRVWHGTATRRLNIMRFNRNWFNMVLRNWTLFQFQSREVHLHVILLCG